MKLRVGAFLAISMISCMAPYEANRTDTMDIHVENQTGNDLQSVNVFVVQGKTVNGTYQQVRTDSSHLGTIADAKTAKGTLSETMILPSDGGYLMTALEKSGKKRSYRFGYLTNGFFSETAQYITVKKDTIFVRH
ncbi:hypothetical protein [Spirosoma agri]|uniref:Uncharacterized protein n=1 Tax=Spirosoma agri TaxID=1987381 RepID=A0A6M0II37_9BACT|nr:hypothetical protein [Spirosoma agri]NEU67001.1 hypothetical protein [Spirosoma agri]